MYLKKISLISLCASLLLLLGALFSFTPVAHGCNGSLTDSSCGGSNGNNNPFVPTNSVGGGANNNAYGSSGYSVSNTGDYYNTVNGAVDNGVNPSGMTDFSGGNQNTTFGSPCANCSATTQSYSNGNGTYNTVTTYSPAEMSSSNGGGGGGGYTYTIASCPSGFTLYSNSCVPNQNCSTTSSGGKGATSVTTCNAPTTTTYTPPPPPSPCTVGGVTVQSGSSYNYYNTATVPYGQSCSSTPRTCTNGSLSGNSSYTFASCVPNPPASCTVGGVTVQSGNTYTYYNTSSVAYNKSCSSTSRTCSNGTLSGDSSYGFSSCVINPPPAMTPITITANPPLIRLGESTTITWDGGNADTCTVTGPSFSQSGITGSTLVNNITGESKFVLKCTLGVTHSATTTVKILPRIQET